MSCRRSIRNESLLNDQDEFPKSPVGVKVADAVILTLSSETEVDGVMITSMLAVSPFLIVISWGKFGQRTEEFGL